MTLIALITLTVATWSVTYVLLRRRVRKEIDELRAELGQQRENVSRKPGTGGSPPEDLLHSDELDPKTLSALGASVSALLGKDVTVSPIHDVSTENGRHHSWAHEGYVAVQHSHDLPIRKATAISNSFVRRAVATDRNERNVA